MKTLSKKDFYVRVEKDDTRILINSVDQSDADGNTHLNQNIKIHFVHNNVDRYVAGWWNFSRPTHLHWAIPFGGYTNVNDDIILKFYNDKDEYLFDIDVPKRYGGHIYNQIDGWFDFQDVYSNIVKGAKDGDHFVEIGAWLGRSTSFMSTEIKNSGKNIKFDVIDTWGGSNEIYHNDFIKNQGSVYDHFLENTSSLKEYINPIIECSYIAPKHYEDESLDFVYIDADHTYEIVKKDIESWYPKVKIGGILAGHDYYNSNQVIRAVGETIGQSNITTNRLSWLHHKKSSELPKK